jgi:hypothetical protein
MIVVGSIQALTGRVAWILFVQPINLYNRHSDDAVSFLLAHGCEVDSTDSQGRTALHFAAAA